MTADPNFKTAKSSISPLIVAATLSSVETVQKLLESKADPNTEDECHGTPLYYATRAGELKIMKLLLKYEADPNDESLHIACQNLDAPAAKLLLDNGASVNLPGFSLSGSRTPLENLCCNANPNRNASDLKRMLKMLAKSKHNLNKLDPEGRSLVFQALDNLSPFEMTTALLAAFPILCETLNEDQNIYRGSDGFCYSPTMYVRYFKCAQSPHENLVIQQPCCNLPDCHALQLEKALYALGCQHRYWNAQSGANQPEFACGFPPDISAAIKAAKETHKLHEAEERARQADKQKRREEQDRLDEDARAVQRRERERLDVIAAGERQIAAAVARRLEAEKTEAREKEAREMRRFDKKRNEKKLLNDDEEKYAQQRDDRMVVTMQKKARIQSNLIEKQQKTIDSATELARELKGQMGSGRILGELIDNQLLLK